MITAATCLAMALYYEARGEGPDGMLAVAEVVINRVQHPDFPGTVCDVIKEDRGPESYDCQFRSIATACLSARRIWLRGQPPATSRIKRSMARC